MVAVAMRSPHLPLQSGLKCPSQPKCDHCVATINLADGPAGVNEAAAEGELRVMARSAGGDYCGRSMVAGTGGAGADGAASPATPEPRPSFCRLWASSLPVGLSPWEA